MTNSIANMTNVTQVTRSSGEPSNAFASNQKPSAKPLGVSAPTNAETMPLQSTAAASTDRNLKESVGLINSAVENVQRDLSFSIDSDSNRTVIKVLDSKSGEVIRQMPTEVALDIASYVRDYDQNAGTQNGLPKGSLFTDSI
jgi:flagellar protein FlaG